MFLVVADLVLGEEVVNGQAGGIEALDRDLPHLADIDILKNVRKEAVGAPHDVLDQVTVGHVESSHLESAALQKRY